MTDQQDVTLTTRLKDILPEPPEKIISVCPKTTLDQLLKALNDNHIQSVPVLEEDGKVLGLVDVLDILNFLLSLDCREYENLEVLCSHCCEELMNASGRNECVTVTQEEPLLNILRVFAAGVHRVPVLQQYPAGEPSHPQISYIFSQLRFLEVWMSHCFFLFEASALYFADVLT